MFKVGLTGGIGCGKTTVANIFAELTVPVIDADQIARQLVQPGEPALAAIIGHFGDSLLAGGQLDRARLRARIFADERQRVWLENLLHPLIYADMQRRVDALPDAYAVLAIPLLLETGRRDFVDRLLVAHVRGDEIVSEVSMAKWWTTDLQKRLTSECVQLHGGYGFMREYPVSEDYADAAVQSIYAGTNEIMKVIIAKRMGLA